MNWLFVILLPNGLLFGIALGVPKVDFGAALDPKLNWLLFD